MTPAEKDEIQTDPLPKNSLPKKRAFTESAMKLGCRPSIPIILLILALLVLALLALSPGFVWSQTVDEKQATELAALAAVRI
jgi:hypothetical protein